MNGIKRKRVPRPIACDPFALAKSTATKLSNAQVAGLIEPLHVAHKALREGVATAHQWGIALGAMKVATAIERQGVVRGLREHIHTAELALQAIERRATLTHRWQPTALYYTELDALSFAVQLHEFQLHALTRGEFDRAFDAAYNQAVSSGARVIGPSDVSAAGMTA